jgi:hypothetical protein
MAATRVRVVLEYRNGNGNFIKQFLGNFVACKHERDREARDAAFLLACQGHDEQLRMISEELSRSAKKAPSHD